LNETGWLRASLRVFRGPVAKAATGSLVIRVSFIGLGFVQSVLLARLAGTEGFGIFAILQALSMLVARLCVFGLDSVAVREIAAARVTDDWSRVWTFVTSSHTLAITIAVPAVVIFLGLGLLLPESVPGGSTSVYAAAVLIVALTLLELLQGINQGLGAIVAAQSPSTVIRTSVFIVLLGAWGLTAGRLSGGVALVLNAFASIVSLALAYLMLRSRLPARHVSARAHQPAYRLLGGGLPFTINSLLLYLNSELTTLVVGAVASPAMAGLFQPVARLSAVMATAQLALAMPLAPKISQLWAGGDISRIQYFTRRSARAAAIVTTATALPLAVASPVILRAFGSEFTTVGLSVYVVAIGQMIGAALGPAALTLNMTGHARTTLAGPVLSIIIVLVTTPPLVSALGVFGASIAMAGAMVLNRSTVCFLVWRRLRILTCI
jgi:O-antigen/teichoic acid export membrane protein